MGWRRSRRGPLPRAGERTVERGPATWAIIAGGGTAGHLLPGLAVAQSLVSTGHDPATVHFVGSDRGVEARMVPVAGFSLDELSGRGIQRRLTTDNIAAVAGLVAALVTGARIVARRRPAVVVVLGGHASFACGVGAVLARVPLVLLEQNVRAGAVNRLLRWSARAAAVSFPGTDLRRVVVTGNPLRPAIRAAAERPDRATARSEARQKLGLPADRVMVAVFSGSLGSRRINEAVAALVRRWRHRDDLAIYHVVGQRDWETYRATAPRCDTGHGADGDEGLLYGCVAYTDDMDLVLLAADVAVTRAGGGVAELAALGVPAILVPLPIATRDHQRANAEALAATGGARVVADEELTAERLAAELDGVLSEPGRLAAMSEGISAAGMPDAAERVAELLVSQASRPPDHLAGPTGSGVIGDEAGGDRR